VTAGTSPRICQTRVPFADEITIKHSGGHLDLPAAMALLGDPALYLIGNVFFKRAGARYYPLSHLVGLGLLALMAPVAIQYSRQAHYARLRSGTAVMRAGMPIT